MAAAANGLILPVVAWGLGVIPASSVGRGLAEMGNTEGVGSEEETGGWNSN